MVRKKGVIKEILTDWKHYLGWIITTISIILVFHFLNIHLHEPFYYSIILFLIIVIIDVIKHKINLQ